MSEQVVVALVTLALAAWIARPLFERRRPAAPDPGDGRTDALMEAKQSVYRSIIDLEMDYRMGKIGEDDYRELRRQSKSEALGLIRQLRAEPGSAEEAEDSPTHEATLEDEIRAARVRLRRQ